MRRSTLAVALLLAVLFPVASPAEDARGPDESAAGGDAATAAEAPADASEAGEKPAQAAHEASSDDAAEKGDAAEASDDEGSAEEASGEEGSASEDKSSHEDDDEGVGAAFREYGKNVGQQFLTGLNGILTWPADPVMAAVDPPKAFDKANSYERRPLGFASGLLLMLYRGFTGTLDMALAPGPLPVLSPVPRYHLVPGFEHEDE